MSGRTGGSGAHLTPPQLRNGRQGAAPARHLLRAGLLSTVLEDGALRWVAFGGHEAVRGLHVAVRDRNWGTVPPRFLSYEVNPGSGRFRVQFTAEHTNDEVDFVWDGVIEGNDKGTITFTMDGVANRTFLKSRIGFCVLHSMELAGTQAEAETPDGIVCGRFPTRIAAAAPFAEMRALRYPVSPGYEIRLAFEGDLFEMEDQRNWTDASYKTFCTPLRLPCPVRINAGDRVFQRVTLKVIGTPPRQERGRVGSWVEIGQSVVSTLPEIGAGFAAREKQPLTAREQRRLQVLGLHHLHVECNLETPGWDERVRAAAAEAAAIGAPIQLEVIADPASPRLAHLVQLLAAMPVPVKRFLAFEPADPARHVSSAELLARVREQLARVGLKAAVGGGSRADFYEFNIHQLPLPLMDVAAYTINPQVHAFDDASVMETLAAQAATVTSARAIAGGLPLCVGPITLKPRFNPVATGPEPAPAPGELPADVDPRQMSLFAAAWTVGSSAHLAACGVQSLTYFETAGLRGLINRAAPLRFPQFPAPADACFPVYHVMADLAAFPGAEVLQVAHEAPGIKALALRAGNRFCLLAANTTAETRRVTVAIPALLRPRLRVLDESNALDAMLRPFTYRRRHRRPIAPGSCEVPMDLAPYAVIRVDGMLAHGERLFRLEP